MRLAAYNLASVIRLRVVWGESVETSEKSWVLKRNCAMSPRQLGKAFIGLGLASLVISMAWALSGAWVVVPFVFLEWGALAVAFLVYARHATDHERVTLKQDKVSVQVVRGERADVYELPREWLRCQFSEGRDQKVILKNRHRELEVGRFVDICGRRRFYEEFRAALAA